MIFILDSSLHRLGVIKTVIDAERTEEINGENTLDFTVKMDEKMSSLITETSIFELDDDYFVVGTMTKELGSDGLYTIAIEADHISYRLNHFSYDYESFYKKSIPYVILGKILYGTGFTVGTIEFPGSVIYQVDEKTSRRQLLMDFAEQIGAELDFNKFQISLLEHRGVTTPTVVVKDRNVEVVTKTINRRTLDTEGRTTISYVCTPIYNEAQVFNLGDEIILRQPLLGIDETLRANRISKNPYDISETTFEFTEYVKEMKQTVRGWRVINIMRGKSYAGVTLDATNGLVVSKEATEYVPPVEDPPEVEILADNRWATIKINNVDGILVNTKDDAGDGMDQLYLEHDDENGRTNLIFDGKLGDNVVTSDKYAGVALDSTNGLVIYKEATEADPKQGIAVLNNKHGILVATKNDAGIQTNRLYLEHDEDEEDTNLVFNGKLSDDVIENQLDPLYGGGGGGEGNTRSTTLQVTITEDGTFYTNTWEHGFNETTQMVQFAFSPRKYLDTVIKFSDLSVDHVDATHVRIIGRADVV